VVNTRMTGLSMGRVAVQITFTRQLDKVFHPTCESLDRSRGFCHMQMCNVADAVFRKTYVLVGRQLARSDFAQIPTKYMTNEVMLAFSSNHSTFSSAFVLTG
jgi:hypothetical protein